MDAAELRWFVESLADGGTHKAAYRPASRLVHTVCGREFVPLAVGMPPRPGPLPGVPLDAAQICPECRRRLHEQ